MSEGVVDLSRRELDRVTVVGAVSEGRLRQREAAETVRAYMETLGEYLSLH